MSSSWPTAIRVLPPRVKDKHAAWLGGLAREINTVFDYCNELSVKVFELRAGNSIHATSANLRKAFLHKPSTRLIKANGAIFVVNAAHNILAAGHRRLAEGIPGR